MKLMKFQREFLASWNINEVEGYLKRNCRRYITWSLYGVFPGFLGQCISVTYTRRKKKIARTTWPETHNEGTREGGTGLKRTEERVKRVRYSRSKLIAVSIPYTVELPSDWNQGVIPPFKNKVGSNNKFLSTQKTKYSSTDPLLQHVLEW